MDNLAALAISKGAMQKREELEGLIDFLQDRELKVILEIGSGVGGTLWLWCQLAEPNATIISVDLPGGPFGGGYSEEDVPKILTYTNHWQHMMLFREDSHSPLTLASVERFLKGRKVDLLYIDGDHTYEGVKQDWEMYSPLVRKGGLVVFHDIADHLMVQQVKVQQLWNELKETHRVTEICAPVSDWGGLGILYL